LAKTASPQISHPVAVFSRPAVATRKIELGQTIIVHVPNVTLKTALMIQQPIGTKTPTAEPTNRAFVIFDISSTDSADHGTEGVGAGGGANRRLSRSKYFLGFILRSTFRFPAFRKSADF
jgi:hypothetical protein